MKVELKIDPNLMQERAIIEAPKWTPKLTAAMTFLEALSDKTAVLTAKRDDKIYLLEPDKVEIIRTEGGKIMLYDYRAWEYTATKPLNELMDTLPNEFVRISKAVIINSSRINHISNSFDRTMHVRMENGMNDYITRSYLAAMKMRLGL